MCLRGYPDIRVGKWTTTLDDRIVELERKTKNLKSKKYRTSREASQLQSLESRLTALLKERMIDRLCASVIVEVKIIGGLDRAAFGQVACYLYCIRQTLNDNQPVMALLSDGIYHSLMVLRGDTNQIVCTDVAISDRLNLVYLMMAVVLPAEDVLGLLMDPAVVCKAGEVKKTKKDEIHRVAPSPTVLETVKSPPAPPGSSGKKGNTKNAKSPTNSALPPAAVRGSGSSVAAKNSGGKSSGGKHASLSQEVVDEDYWDFGSAMSEVSR